MTTTTYDAIIIGAGHNGLVTAAYLAKAGLRTLVLERRDRAGGPLTTEEIVPGVRAPVADHVGGVRAALVRDLQLESHGFGVIEPDVAAFAPSVDGRGVTLWRDPARTARDLREPDAFLAFDRKVRSLGRFLARLQATEPPDLASPSPTDALKGLTLLNAARQLGKEQIRETTRVLPMSVADFVGERVQDNTLRAALGSPGIR